MSVWFDIKKEPLPNNVSQVLVSFGVASSCTFGVVTCYEHCDDGVNKTYEYWDDDACFDQFGVDPHSDCRITHWQYIDPTGITE